MQLKNDDKAVLEFRGKRFDLPVVCGTEQECAVEIDDLRSKSGLITLDPSYGNTGSCTSEITFIDGEQGILRYRGYPIEELAEQSSFLETAWLVIFGELPSQSQLAEFEQQIAHNSVMHDRMRRQFEHFPLEAPPMAVLAAMINAAGCYHPMLMEPTAPNSFMDAATRLLGMDRTIAAAGYKMSVGHPIAFPRYDLSYTANFLHMMFSLPNRPFEPAPELVSALDLIFVLHADHEQNCSTSTVRMVGSSQSNLYASVAAGVCALWGPLHGGANQAVIEMLEDINRRGESVDSVIRRVKDKDQHFKLMGFGHRVYKNFDPRARIIKRACDRVLKKLGIRDPLLDIAMKLEEAALRDDYFVERKLYPNVDFYSGIIMRAMGIPVDMFTVIFAIGRMPGWIANWREVHMNPKARIARPRQVYAGEPLRKYKPIGQRG